MGFVIADQRSPRGGGFVFDFVIEAVLDEVGLFESIKLQMLLAAVEFGEHGAEDGVFLGVGGRGRWLLRVEGGGEGHRQNDNREPVPPTLRFAQDGAPRVVR